MKRKFRLILIVIIIVYTVTSYFFIANYLKQEKLQEVGVTTNVERELFEQRCYNYYFMSGSEKIYLTHNVNTKGESDDFIKYFKKEIVYLKTKPNIYILKDEIQERNYKYYFITLPLVFFIIIWFFYPKRKATNFK